MKQKFAVLGAGAFGTAIGGVLEEKGNEVAYYDPVLAVSLEEVLEGAEVLVLVTPSAAIWELLPRLPKNLPLVVATKGLMDEEIFGDFQDWMVMSGPGFAKDIKGHKAVKLTETDKRVEEWFGTEKMKFDFTTDRRGVMLCGALKNVYAILAGRLELEPGSRALSDYLDEVTEEMKTILVANGCEAATVELACGVGDLALTCTPSSRNYQFGKRLSEDPKAQPEETVEGVSALKRIERGEIVVPPQVFRLRYLLAESKKWEENI